MKHNRGKLVFVDRLLSGRKKGQTNQSKNCGIYYLYRLVKHILDELNLVAYLNVRF